MDPEGNLWVSDEEPTKYYNNGAMYATSANITNTALNELYRTERNSGGKPDLLYTIELLPSTYDVTLHFAEVFKGAFGIGKRVFQVYIQGELVLKDFDVYKEAGEGNRAIAMTLKDVDVSNGILLIDFVRNNGGQYPKVQAIEVHEASDPTAPPVDPTFAPVNPTPAPVDPTPAPAVDPTPAPVDVSVKSSPPSTSLPSPTASPFVLLINAGGKDYIDPDGNTWVSDKGYYNAGSKSYQTRARIANTNKPALYKTERNNEELLYIVERIPNGFYNVSLHYAEIFSKTSAIGARLFDVYIQGILVSQELDVFKAAGGAETAFIDTFLVEVSEGYLTLDFIGLKQHAKVSAIEIRGVE